MKLPFLLLTFLFLSKADSQSIFERIDQTRPDRYNLLSYQERQFHSTTKSDFEILGRWGWGDCWAMEITGNYALVGQGSSYQVLEISDPSKPRIVYDTTLSGWVTDIKIKDSLLLTLQATELVIYKATPPFPLVEIGRAQLGIGGPYVDMSVSDSLLFIIGDNVGVLVFNIENPYHPTFRKRFGLIYEIAQSIASKGLYAYYGPLGPGFRLQVLRYRSDSTIAFKPLDILNATATYIRDTLLFVGTLSADFCIYNITDPWNPQLLDSINLGTPAMKIIAKGNNVYCSTWDSGMVVLNLMDSLKAREVGISNFRSHAHNYAVKISRSNDVLAGSSLTEGVAFYSISEADSISDRSFFATGGHPTDVVVKGNIGFVGCGSAGLWSVNFSDPVHPKPIDHLPGASGRLVFSGNILSYFSNDSLVTVAVNDSGGMASLGGIPFCCAGNSIASRDSLLVVGNDSSADVFSISNSSMPLMLSTLPTQGTTYAQILGDYLYVGDGRSGEIKVIDVSSPSSPIQKGSLQMGVITGILAKDSLLFVANDTGLVIINIFNPLAPQTVGMVSTSGSRTQVRMGVEKGFLYMAYDRVHVLDISNPTNPTEVETLLDEFSLPGGVFTGNGLLYVASPDEGVWVARNKLITSIQDNPENVPTSFAVYQNYPNPFNGQTQFKFEVPSEHQNTFVRVSLKVYDLLGREIASVIDEDFHPGVYTRAWRGARLSSGAYFYKFRIGSSTIVKKMAVIN